MAETFYKLLRKVLFFFKEFTLLLTLKSGCGRGGGLYKFLLITSRYILLKITIYFGDQFNLYFIFTFEIMHIWDKSQSEW